MTPNAANFILHIVICIQDFFLKNALALLVSVSDKALVLIASGSDDALVLLVCGFSWVVVTSDPEEVMPLSVERVSVKYHRISVDK